VNDELSQSTADLASADRAFFRYFFARSGESPERRTELWERYKFLLGMQRIVMALNQKEHELGPVVAALKSGRELKEGDAQFIRTTLGNTRRELVKAVKACAALPLPKLLHLEDGASARDFVLSERVVSEAGDELTAYWINELLRQFGQALGRTRKLHFKNLGALLALQEALDPHLFTVDAAQDC
jgi:hypothetical protein